MTLGRRLVTAASAALMTLATVLFPTAAVAAPAQFDEYYRYFDVGPKWQIYAHSRWVPQGLTKLSENTLVISYYDRFESLNSIVALVDRSTGNWLRTYPLDIKGHVGGIAATSGHLWVTYGDTVRRYPRSQLSRTGGTTMTTSYSRTVAAASYAFAEGNYLWVGQFDETSREYMYRYTVDSAGNLSSSWSQRVYTPSRVQGVVVTPTRIVWSQSFGRDNDSQLIFWPRGTTYNGSTSIGNWLTAPNMSEGLVVAGGQIQVIFESCSEAYDGTADGNAADYIVCSIHHGGFPNLP